MPYLVYMKNPGGGAPVPQLWLEDQTKGTGEFQHKPVGHPESKLVSFYEVSDREAKELTLDNLATCFPHRDGVVMWMADRRGVQPGRRSTQPQFGHRSLRDANCARQLEWEGQIKASLGFYGNELGGEVGEALNVLKKLERERLGIRGSRASVKDMADECADVVICLDLVAIEFGPVPLRLDKPLFEAPHMSLDLLGCQLFVSVGRVLNRIIEKETTRSDANRDASFGLCLDDSLAVVKRIANEVGFSLMSAVVRKFNETSVKYDLTTKMEVSSANTEHQAWERNK